MEVPATASAESAVRDAGTGLRLAGVEVAQHGTRVHLSWDVPDGPSVVGFVVERALRPEGPWQNATSLPAGQRITKLDLRASLEWFRLGVRRSSGAQFGQPIRAATVGRSLYDFGDQVVPGAVFHKAIIWGVVHAPVALAAPEVAPIVLLVHGNNGVCRAADGTDTCDLGMVRQRACPDGMHWTPNGEGLAWLADTLAAAGMVAVVLDLNTTNCAPLPDIVQGRAAVVLEHLRRWQTWATVGGQPFGSRWVGRVDLGQVVVVGHSNGAEAAALLPALLAQNGAEPELAGVKVGAIVSVASTDNLQVVLEDTALLTVLPSCDQQLSLMEGKRIHDRASKRGRAPLSEVLIIGGNHNGFNTKWLSDERLDTSSDSDVSACPVASKLAGDVQRRLLGVLATSFIDGVVRRQGVLEPFLRAEAPSPSGLVAYMGQDAELRWSYTDPNRLPIDNFDKREQSMNNALGGRNRFENFHLAARCFGTDCDPEFDHPLWAVRLEWRQPGARALFRFDAVDTVPFTALSFRAAQCLHGEFNPVGKNMDFAIRLSDGAGNDAVVRISEAGHLPYPSTLATSRPMLMYLREQLHTVRVPLASFAAHNPRLNLRAISAISLEMSSAANPAGAIMLTQVELTR